MLSRSDVLAVQLLRDQLDLAVGGVLPSSREAGLLTRWLFTDMGAADCEAVKALGRLVGRGMRGTSRSGLGPLVEPVETSVVEPMEVPLLGPSLGPDEAGFLC
ncbi:hypothetical protein QF036_001362 [Arthrobacter globiformis]|nr:hypothetical protein [Arthrobacter globiformis]